LRKVVLVLELMHNILNWCKWMHLFSVTITVYLLWLVVQCSIFRWCHDWVVCIISSVRERLEHSGMCYAKGRSVK
jgi:hypothetical protein